VVVIAAILALLTRLAIAGSVNQENGQYLLIINGLIGFCANMGISGLSEVER